MRLWLVVKETFAVHVVENPDSEHDCSSFLAGDWTPPNEERAKERRRLLRLLEQASKNPRTLSAPCHTIAEGIWQFKVSGGVYRIPWFYDENKLIICTHYFVKKGQKTPASERDRARRLKDDYFSKKAKGSLEWKE